MLDSLTMIITENKVELKNAGLTQVLTFDVALDNEEAITAEAVADVGAAVALLITEPFGAIVSALIELDKAEIHSHNKGRGVGLNIHAEGAVELGVPPIVTYKKYFSA